MLIQNWTQAWKMFSVQAAALLVAWATIPEAAQASFLSALGISKDVVTAILGGLVIVGRLVNQPGLRDDEPAK